LWANLWVAHKERGETGPYSHLNKCKTGKRKGLTIWEMSPMLHFRKEKVVWEVNVVRKLPGRKLGNKGESAISDRSAFRKRWRRYNERSGKLL